MQPSYAKNQKKLTTLHEKVLKIHERAKVEIEDIMVWCDSASNLCKPIKNYTKERVAIERYLSLTGLEYALSMKKPYLKHFELLAGYYKIPNQENFQAYKKLFPQFEKEATAIYKTWKRVKEEGEIYARQYSEIVAKEKSVKDQIKLKQEAKEQHKESCLSARKEALDSMDQTQKQLTKKERERIREEGLKENEKIFQEKRNEAQLVLIEKEKELQSIKREIDNLKSLRKNKQKSRFDRIKNLLEE